MGPKLHNLCKEGHQKLGGTSSNNDKYMHQIWIQSIHILG